MFKVYDVHRKTTLQFTTFSEALSNIRGTSNYITDAQGYKYFGDGTGLGFRALKQSNQELFYNTNGVYSQKKLKFKNLYSNARSVLHNFGHPDALQYIARVRALKSQNQINITIK